jgi:hypothetical protein
VFLTVRAAPHSRESAFVTLSADKARPCEPVERLAQLLHYRLSNQDLDTLIAELRRRRCPDA